MSFGAAASLTCPACVRAFLSAAPQSPGALLICPHCACSAPASAFAAAGGRTPHAPAVLMQRRVLPARPAAPAPSRASSSAQALFDAALAKGMVVTPELIQAVINAVPQSDSPPGAAHAESFTGAPHSEFSPGMPSDDPSPRHRQPSGVFQPTLAIDQEYVESAAAARLKDRRRWILPLAVFPVMGIAGLWMVLESSKPHPEAAALAAAAAPDTFAAPPAARGPSRSAALPEPLQAPPEPKLDLAAAHEASAALIGALFQTTSHDERVPLVQDAALHRTAMERFFAQPDLSLHAVKPVPGSPLKLPGGHGAAVFQVLTSANPHGALLRLQPRQEGGFLIEWPLFHDTHERSLERLQQDDQETEPAWFDVALRRSHGLDLPETVRKRQWAFDVQGSADASLLLRASLDQDTPLGRYLESATQWGQIYLTRLLLQRRPLTDGVSGVVILDCDGARSARGWQ